MFRLNSGICPKCAHIVEGVKLEHLRETEAEGLLPNWKVISFCCYNCGTVLGVSFDPLEIAELVANKMNAGVIS